MPDEGGMLAENVLIIAGNKDKPDHAVAKSYAFSPGSINNFMWVYTFDEHTVKEIFVHSYIALDRYLI
jgi:hypothetical protein